MGYRDELGAAQARADAVSKELEAEKAARGNDAVRLAELERSLAASLQELAALRERKGSQNVAPAPMIVPQAGGQNTSFAVGGVALSILLVGGMAGYMMLSTASDEPALGKSYENFAPADAEFDVSDQLDVAKRAAARFFDGEFRSGPHLREIVAKAVDDEGRNHLAFGGVEYKFSVELEELQRRVDDGPVGTRPKQVDERDCHVAIRVDSEGIKIPADFMISIESMPGLRESQCSGRSIEPRCTLREIRKRSLADGAPKGAMAQVSIGYGRKWNVVIEDQGKEIFQSVYADDCE